MLRTAKLLTEPFIVALTAFEVLWFPRVALPIPAKSQEYQESNEMSLADTLEDPNNLAKLERIRSL